jgi:DNA-binding MarR family transcriptional regulator
MAAKIQQEASGKELHDLFKEIFAVHVVLSAIMDKIHEQSGLTTSECRIMRVLEQGDKLTVPDIAVVLGKSRQFVQTVCNDLHAHAYLEFVDNPRHKRSKRVILTDSGQQVFCLASEKENMTIEQIISNVDQKKALQVCKILKKIREDVEGQFI